MKKTTFLMLVALIVSACAAPQVTVTPEATVTLTPTPIPTSHPEFAALLQTIADAGLRFTLQADGLVYDGDTPIPGLTVAPDGTMTLTVDGESVTLDPADVDFDDEKGISIDGYEWYDGVGAWVEANETVTLGGVTLTLDENGVVTDMSVEGNYTSEQKTEKLKAVDPTNWGFDKGEVQIVVDGSDRFITPVGDPETKIAKWYFASNEWEWDLDVMKGLEGGNPLFDFAKTFESNERGIPVDGDAAKADKAEIKEFFPSVVAKISGKKVTQPVLINEFSGGSDTIVAWLTTDHLVDDPAEASSGEIDGVIYLKTSANELVSMKVKNLDFTIWK